MKMKCYCCKKSFNRPKSSLRKNQTKVFCSSKCYLKIKRKYHVGQVVHKFRRDNQTDPKQKKYQYRYVYVKGRSFVEEHRLVMEKKLKRRLKVTDIVHHINGNTLDNRVSNLRVFKSPLDHLKAHGRLPPEYESEYEEYIREIFGINKIRGLYNYKLTFKYPKYDEDIERKRKFDRLRKLIQESFDELPTIKDKDNSNAENCLVYSKFYKKGKNG